MSLIWKRYTLNKTPRLTTTYERDGIKHTVRLTYCGRGQWVGDDVSQSGFWRVLGQTDLRSMKDKIGALATGKPSPWRISRRYGYRYSASGALANYTWRPESQEWVVAVWSSGLDGTYTERFPTADLARAFCDKAITQT